MSTQIFEENGVTITRFSRGSEKGMGYQVTWGMDEYVHFANEEDARDFIKALNKRIKLERL